MAQAKSKPKVSPIGTMEHVHLTLPDTKYVQTGVFHGKLLVPHAEAEAMLSEARDVIRAKLAETKAQYPGKQVQAADTKTIQKRDDGVLFHAKMKHSGVSKRTQKPWERWLPIFDADGNPIPKEIPVFSGSRGRFAYIMEGYAQFDRKTDSYDVGVTIRLEAVQIAELVTAGANAGAVGFGKIEGGTVVVAGEPETDGHAESDDEPNPWDF